MAAERMDSTNGETDTDARMQIQEIIEDLNLDELNLAEPSNETLDGKIDKLDRIFSEYVEGNEPSQTGKGKSVDVSHARLDIRAFSMLASINHQRIRRVAASSWTFRATDFANRIVRLMNMDEGSQSECLTRSTKGKLDQMVSPYFNQCTPLRPLLGAITLTKTELAPPKEKKQRQPKEKEQAAVQKLQPKKLTEITEEDQNTKVVKRVQHIMRILKGMYKNNGGKPISFYHFVLDPTSFSNSVENLFYVSFLIKDGFVSLSEESESGLPELVVMRKNNDESQSQACVTKKQLILTFDFGMWQEMVGCLGLEKAAIEKEASSRDQPAHKRLRQ